MKISSIFENEDPQSCDAYTCQFLLLVTETTNNQELTIITILVRHFLSAFSHEVYQNGESHKFALPTAVCRLRHEHDRFGL